MASSNQAPEISFVERPFSQRIEPGSATIFATIGMFSKGPVNERVQINSPTELKDTFGTPSDYNYQYFLPISTILDVAPCYVVRVEESTKYCAGSTVAVSGGNTVKNATPVQVQYYPLSYDTLFTGVTPPIDLTGLTDSISILAVGPGTLYNNIGYSIITAADYNQLQTLALDISEAQTPSALQTVGQTAYNLAVSGSGITFDLIEDLIDPSNSYKVDTELLQTYLQFDFGPQGTTQFAFYEFSNDTLLNYWLVSVDPEEKDQFSKVMFANTVIGDSSDNLKVFVGNSKLTASAVTPKSVGKTYLSGASALSTSAATLTDELYEQLANNYSSKEEVPNITAFVDLDFPLAIKQKMDSIASTRAETVALLNVPADKMINLTSGIKVSNQTTKVKNWADNDMNIASSYSALYANYFEVYDSFNDEYRWVPCTGHVANRMAFTIINYEAFFAIAGFERGILPSGIRRVAYNPSEEQRRIIYPARINPVVDFRGEGIVIFGQKTLQSFASNSDRLNIRMLFNMIKKDVGQFSKSVLFTQNDALTRAQWRAQVSPYLTNLIARRGIDEFRLVCDETNNTDATIARNEFHGYIIVRPVNSIEFVKLVLADVGGTLTIDEVLAGVNV